ncbi:MaoC family dehydratase N-terminal domain-containing protein [Streptomyces avermitilis]|uniref:FAS1-like dehydratase domain-containing protein n=1 Tax=Streptomyces avermitilis TaxID=33903 RepID=UPI0033DDB324
MSAVLDEVLSRARELIGTWEDEDCGTVTLKDFCRYAAAVGDTDYIRRARARDAAGEPVTAPALFLSGTLSWEDGPAEDELRPDGLSVRESPCTQGLPVRQVHGGQSVRLVRAPVSGTRVTASRAVTSADHRRGRTGEFVLFAVTTRFTSQDGDELMVQDETIVVLNGPDSVSEGSDGSDGSDASGVSDEKGEATA